MQVKGFLYVVDVLCLAVFDLFERVDLFDEVCNGLILVIRVKLIVELIDVNDLDSNDLTSLFVFAVKQSAGDRVECESFKQAYHL